MVLAARGSQVTTSQVVLLLIHPFVYPLIPLFCLQCADPVLSRATQKCDMSVPRNSLTVLWGRQMAWAVGGVSTGPMGALTRGLAGVW